MPSNCRAVKTLRPIWHQTISGLLNSTESSHQRNWRGSTKLFGRPTVAKLLLLHPQVYLSLTKRHTLCRHHLSPLQGTVTNLVELLPSSRPMVELKLLVNHEALVCRHKVRESHLLSVKNCVKSMFKPKSLILALGILGLFSNTSMAKDAIATATRVSGDGQHARFEADLSKAVGFNVYVLNQPNRVIIDMSGVSFDLAPGLGHETSGLINSYRYGVVDDGKSRIVIDTAGPVLISKSYAVPAKGKKPAHIVVELLQTSQDAFDATYAKDHPEIQTAASSPSKTREKEVVLAYGLALRDALQKTGNYNVVMTRDDDTFIPLEGRVKIARDNKADLFIAIHADTVQGEEARGTTVYTVSDKATDAEAEALAQKENRADIIAGIDLGSANKQVADILINLAQRESKNQAMYFSKKAVTELKQVTTMTGKPIRSAAFVVLKAPDVPSVLVELGYLSSKQDEKLLLSVDWRARMAGAMTKAIEAYFQPSQTISQN
jgi:N-acetylmuramoyl-L-alanine amidase